MSNSPWRDEFERLNEAERAAFERVVSANGLAVPKMQEAAAGRGKGPSLSEATSLIDAHEAWEAAKEAVNEFFRRWEKAGRPNR